MMHVYDMHASYHAHGKGAVFELLIRLLIDYGPTLASWLAILPSWPVMLVLVAGLAGTVAWRVGQGPLPFRPINGLQPPNDVEIAFVGLVFALAVWPAYAYAHALALTGGEAIATLAGVGADALLVVGLRYWYLRAQGRATVFAAQREAVQVFSTRRGREPDSPIS